MRRLNKYVNKITALCKKHKVKNLYVFGSILTDDFNKDSDVDFFVDFDQISTEDYIDNYFDLKFSLEDILNKSVDLLEEKAIRNPYFRQNINQQKQLVYEH